MGDIRKSYGSALKAKVVLEALKGQKTAAELASQYKVHATQITRWKKQVLDILPEAFSNRQHKERAEAAGLYRQIGQLKQSWTVHRWPGRHSRPWLEASYWNVLVTIASSASSP